MLLKGCVCTGENSGNGKHGNYKMDEYGSESYEKHTHNTEATKGGTYIDSQKHYENVACKDCPIGYVTETKVEREHTYENGFCKACDAYEPAVLNSNNAYEIGNAGQLYWFADKVNKERLTIKSQV